MASNPPIPAGMYRLRVFQPTYGPKIVTALMSDLGTIPSVTDLVGQSIYIPSVGSPSSTTLLAGNYSAALPGSGYLVGDAYLDASAPALWICTTAGSNQVGQNGGSVWQQISGAGGGFSGDYDPTIAYNKGSIVRVGNTTTILGVTVYAGYYGAAQNVPVAASMQNPGYVIPQFPEPQQGAYWRCMVFTAQAINQNCGTGLMAFVNATNPITITPN